VFHYEAISSEQEEEEKRGGEKYCFEKKEN